MQMEKHSLLIYFLKIDRLTQRVDEEVFMNPLFKNQ